MHVTAYGKYAAMLISALHAAKTIGSANLSDITGKMAIAITETQIPLFTSLEEAYEKGTLRKLFL